MKCEARGTASSHLCAFSQLLSSAARAWRFVDMAAHSRMACTGRGEGERRYGVLRVGRVEYLRDFFFLSRTRGLRSGAITAFNSQAGPHPTGRWSQELTREFEVCSTCVCITKLRIYVLSLVSKKVVLFRKR